MGATDKQQSKKKTKRARLGRGLSSLVDSAPVKVEHEPAAASDTEHTANPLPSKAVSEPGTQVLELPVSSIVPNPHQPRRVFDNDALRVLADSIREHGLMQPIVVREASGGGYELIAGERRWRATQAAGLETIRAVVEQADDERSAELALIENIQRSDLNPIERANGLRLLMERFGLTQQRVAERMGMSRSALANLVRLLDLSEEIQGWVAEGTLSTGHAKVLLSCENPDERADLARAAIAEGWTVRTLESKCAAGAKHEPEPSAGSTTTPDQVDRVTSVLRDLERSMSEHFGTEVTLKTDRGGTKGRISIAFYDLDQFDGLLERLGMRADRH